MPQTHLVASLGSQFQPGSLGLVQVSVRMHIGAVQIPACTRQLCFTVLVVHSSMHTQGSTDAVAGSASRVCMQIWTSRLGRKWSGVSRSQANVTVLDTHRNAYAVDDPSLQDLRDQRYCPAA